MDKPKLLLADDSVTIRKVVELTFADEGIDVTAVSDADSAMQRFVETQPDIVLVDASLAGTSGYRICEMIKADEATKHIPVLLLVGSFERFDDDEAVRVGADGFMTKPFQSIRELVAKVRDLLEAPSERTTQENIEIPPVPVFGEAFAEPQSEPSVPLTESEEQPGADEDIDNLYRESIAPESAAFEDAAEDELLGHIGMDDDMIEASPKSGSAAANDEYPGEFAPDGESVEIPLNRDYDPDKKFDWSPDAVVSAPETSGDSALEPPFAFADDDVDGAGNEDEPGGDSGEEPDDTEISGFDTIEMGHVSAAEPEAPHPSELDDDAEILDLDLGPSPVSVASTFVGAELSSYPVADAAPEEEADPSIHETIPYEDGEQPPIQPVESPASPEEFPAELIERIAQKVIERLSDNVVREVARIEVPRVAEKLIREALDGRK